MLRKIETLEGAVVPEKLGLTLMHEHIVLVDYDVAANWPPSRVGDTEIDLARERLRDAVHAGVSTIVDMTIPGLSRNLPLVQRIAADVGLTVIAATGVFVLDEMPRFFRNRGSNAGNGVDQLCELFISDIEHGIGDSSVRAGILKCAMGPQGPTSDVERVIRATAQAHRHTGVPISTHSDVGTRRGLDQQRILASEGVDLSRVVIGHCDGTDDLDHLRELMDAGSTIGLDRFGLEPIATLDQRVAVVATLTSMGYADRIVLSHDSSCITHSYGDPTRRAELPDWQYPFLPTTGAARLRAAGVSQEQLDQMLVHNPRRILTPVEPY